MGGALHWPGAIMHIPFLDERFSRLSQPEEILFIEALLILLIKTWKRMPTSMLCIWYSAVYSVSKVTIVDYLYMLAFFLVFLSNSHILSRFLYLSGVSHTIFPSEALYILMWKSFWNFFFVSTFLSHLHLFSSSRRSI